MQVDTTRRHHHQHQHPDCPDPWTYKPVPIYFDAHSLSHPPAHHHPSSSFVKSHALSSPHPLSHISTSPVFNGTIHPGQVTQSFIPSVTIHVPVKDQDGLPKDQAATECIRVTQDAENQPTTLHNSTGRTTDESVETKGAETDGHVDDSVNKVKRPVGTPDRDTRASHSPPNVAALQDETNLASRLIEPRAPFSFKDMGLSPPPPLMPDSPPPTDARLLEEACDLSVFIEQEAVAQHSQTSHKGKCTTGGQSKFKAKHMQGQSTDKRKEMNRIAAKRHRERYKDRIQGVSGENPGYLCARLAIPCLIISTLNHLLK